MDTDDTAAPLDPFAAALGALVGEERAGRMLADVPAEAPVPDGAPPAGAPGGRAGTLDELCPGGAAALVGALGLDLDHDTAAATARDVLAARGHDAEVVSVRWGVLTVECGPVAGQLLTFDRDQVLADVAARGVTTVSRLRVRVRRDAPDGAGS